MPSCSPAAPPCWSSTRRDAPSGRCRAAARGRCWWPGSRGRRRPSRRRCSRCRPVAELLEPDRSTYQPWAALAGPRTCRSWCSRRCWGPSATSSSCVRACCGPGREPSSSRTTRSAAWPSGLSWWLGDPTARLSFATSDRGRPGDPDQRPHGARPVGRADRTDRPRRIARGASGRRRDRGLGRRPGHRRAAAGRAGRGSASTPPGGSAPGSSPPTPPSRQELATELERGPARRLRDARGRPPRRRRRGRRRCRAADDHRRGAGRSPTASCRLSSSTGASTPRSPVPSGAPEARGCRAAVEVTAYLLARDDADPRFLLDDVALRVALSAPPPAELVDRVEAVGGASPATTSCCLAGRLMATTTILFTESRVRPGAATGRVTPMGGRDVEHRRPPGRERHGDDVVRRWETA